MKKILLIALIISGITANAQYFQHIYGTPNDNFLTSGINTVIQPQGHFLAGMEKSQCHLGISTIPAVYSDINGNIPGAPFFQRDYMLTGPTGSILHARDAKVFELNNGSGFGIIGMYWDPNNPGINGVYYLMLNATGVPVATFDYPALPGGGFTFNVIEVGGITKSTVAATINDVYVTGTASDNTGQPNVFALDINSATGALVWSQIYNILPPVNGPAWGKDVAENPLMPFGFQSIAVVGTVFSNWGGPFSNDGFLMHIDATTGLPAPHPIIICGQPFSDDHLNSINACVGPPGIFPPGFVLGGGTNINGSMDFFVLRMDFLIAPFFFNTFDFSMVPGSYNECFDVMERLNTACQFEYYAVGHTDNGPFGLTDVMVVKMDQFGNGVPGGEFIYGSPNSDFGRSVDMLNIGAPCAPPPMPAPAGLSVFGTWGGPPSLGAFADLYHIKAYYNGVSGCNEIFNNPLQMAAFPTMPMSPFINISNFGMGNLTAGFSMVNDITLCFNPAIGVGNNNKTENPDKGDKSGTRPDIDQGAVVIPNPTEVGTERVLLKVETEIAGDATVAIYDMLGKQYYTGKFTLYKGVNQLPLDISKANMAAGIYSVVVQTEVKASTSQLIIK